MIKERPPQAEVMRFKHPVFTFQSGSSKIRASLPRLLRFFKHILKGAGPKRPCRGRKLVRMVLTVEPIGNGLAVHAVERRAVVKNFRDLEVTVIVAPDAARRERTYRESI